MAMFNDEFLLNRPKSKVVIPITGWVDAWCRPITAIKALTWNTWLDFTSKGSGLSGRLSGRRRGILGSIFEFLGARE